MTLTLVAATTVPESCAAFRKSLTEQGLSELTVKAYLSDVSKFGLDESTTVAEHLRVAQTISADSVAAPSTRARYLSALAKFFAYAHPGTDNPYKAVRRPRKGIVLPAVVPTPEESRSIVEALLNQGDRRSVMYAAMIVLMAGAGLRVSEVCALRAADVNLDSSTVRVRDGKGGKTRDVPLGEYAKTVLSRHMLDGPERAAYGASDPLFQVTPRTVQRAVKRAAEAAGGNIRLHPHAFRHGFGTSVQEQVGDLRLTADLLGHSSISTTTIYTHVTDSRRQAAVAHVL